MNQEVIPFLKKTKENGQHIGEVGHVRKDGTTFQARASSSILRNERGAPIGIIGITHNITKDLKCKAQLRQAQKMEAMGTLAGNIAHDFNNLLCAITGYIEMTMDNVPEDSIPRSNLEEMLKVVRRGKDLVQQIFAFSRQDDQEPEPLQVQLVIEEALKLLKAILPNAIEVHQNIDEDCGLVLADATQIHQVIMNLCTNAYHAMLETGGKLEVTLTEIDIGPDGLIGLDIDPAGTYLCLTVSDTGQGVDSAVIDRIFDPYFTTKEKGKGTGLGLAIVHRIVKSYGGDISIYSEPGKGTVTNVYLPIIDTGIKVPETVSSEPVARPAFLTGLCSEVA